jgi:hypothetical protein
MLVDGKLVVFYIFGSTITNYLPVDSRVDDFVSSLLSRGMKPEKRPDNSVT